MNENVPEKPYAVRFVQLSPRLSYQAMASGRSRILSPRDIKQILAKFKISEADFIEAVAEYHLASADNRPEIVTNSRAAVLKMPEAE